MSVTSSSAPGRTVPSGRSAAPRPRRRRSPGWVPNQHGAWAMLVAPFLVGAVAAGPAVVQLPLAAVWVLGYFAFFAAGLWLKSHRRDRYLPPVRAYAAATVPPGLAVVLLRPDLLVWVPLFVPLLATGLRLAHLRRDRSLVSGLVMVVAAMLMTLVAYDAGHGADWARAGTMTAVLAAYFVGTVLFVKTMIRERGHAGYLGLSVAWHTVCAVAMWWLSPVLVLLFAALALRAVLLPRLQVGAKRVGMAEIPASILVVAATLLVL